MEAGKQYYCGSSLEFAGCDALAKCCGSDKDPCRTRISGYTFTRALSGTDTTPRLLSGHWRGRGCRLFSRMDGEVDMLR